jgi:hypothetical protein
MLYRKALIVLLLALISGCVDKAKNEELDKVYQQQLMSYNDQIRETDARYNNLYERVYNDITLELVRLGDQITTEIWEKDKREIRQEEIILNELVDKRRELKIKIIEQFGSLPSWWTEEKASTEQ